MGSVEKSTMSLLIDLTWVFLPMNLKYDVCTYLMEWISFLPIDPVGGFKYASKVGTVDF